MAADQSGYSPIEDYGVIGNGHSAALINKAGRLDWLCWPRFDSPSIFARILDAERGGAWTIQPIAPFKSSHRYVPDTNVLETTFTTAAGCIRLYDCMVMPDADAVDIPLVLLRVVEGVAGEVEIVSMCEPRPNYARSMPEFVVDGETALFDEIGVTAPAMWDVNEADGALRTQLHVQPGQRIAWTLHRRDEAARPAVEDPVAALEATIVAWQTYARLCTYTGPYRDMVVRSVLALKLLIYMPSGAIVAAPTTSLPEAIGGLRNWDYRFTWSRDASFTLYALLLAGYRDEDDPFFAWIVRRVQIMGTGINILYPISPEGIVREQILDHLSGYRNSRPVRIGNGAADQLQLDVYGEVLDALHFAWKAGQYDPGEVWMHCHQLVEWVADNWNQPENGIWEVRGGRRHFVYGKVMCWVALDRAIDLAENCDLPGDVARWREERNQIRADVFAKGWSEHLGAFKQSYEDELLDAANLLLPVVGFIEGDDPRMIATVDATLKHLVVDDLCYRYLDAPDGLPKGEATFTLCTFWLIDALILAGREAEAQRLFERMLDRATPLGLYAEELDPTTGAHLGNFPQAFSHIGLINAAVSLAHVGQVGAVEARFVAMADCCRTGISGARRTRSAHHAVADSKRSDPPNQPT